MSKKKEVPAIDGIPGIMPGIGSLLPPPEEGPTDETLNPNNVSRHHSREDLPTPVHQRRMMPCDRQEKK